MRSKAKRSTGIKGTPTDGGGMRYEGTREQIIKAGILPAEKFPAQKPQPHFPAGKHDFKVEHDGRMVTVGSVYNARRVEVYSSPLAGERKLHERALEELSHTSGIPVADLRARIEERKVGRDAKAAKERERSIRLSLGVIADCLTDVHDLAHCEHYDRTGALDPTTIMHAIERITEACREEFGEVCKALELTPLHSDQDADDQGGDHA